MLTVKEREGSSLSSMPSSTNQATSKEVMVSPSRGLRKVRQGPSPIPFSPPP